MAKVNLLASRSINNQREAAYVNDRGGYYRALALACRARVEHCLFPDGESFARKQHAMAEVARWRAYLLTAA